MTLKKFKIYIIAGVFLFIVLLVLILIVSTGGNNIRNEKEKVVPTLLPRPSIVESVIGKPTVIEPSFTGAKDEGLKTDEQAWINQSFELKRKLPVKTDSFSLDYDYKRTQFVVTVNPPVSENRVIFDQWLKDQGFAGIPKERFLFR